jgi:hypothetical protein
VLERIAGLEAVEDRAYRADVVAQARYRFAPLDGVAADDVPPDLRREAELEATV